MVTPRGTATTIEEPAQTPWQSQSVASVERVLQVDEAVGLTDAEVEIRQTQYGRNEVTIAASESWWPLLLRQFAGSLTLILLAAMVVSIAIGDHLEAIVIAIIVVVNGVLGFAQEWRAGRAIEALEAMLVPHARVRRNAMTVLVEAVELVPGDVVELTPGDRIPADLRLTATLGLMVDESALTGESAAMHKSPEPVPESASLAQRPSMVYMGTQVMAGRGTAIVTGTGLGTELGNIIELTNTAEDSIIPLQVTLTSLARRLGQIAVAIAALTIAARIAAGRGAEEMFLTGVSLAVAVVPEGLPTVVIVTLALGIRTMSARKALLRNLAAAETLGQASVICTDKTGTLTENRMEVRKVWTTEGRLNVADLDDAELSVTVGYLVETAQVCNNARLGKVDTDDPGLGDPTEIALLELARWVCAPEPDAGRLTEIPFDSESKLMSVTVAADGGIVDHVKGAPEIVLDRCGSILTNDGNAPLSDEDRLEVLAEQERMAESGLRTLALARSSQGDLTSLVFIGLVGMHDPPRAGVPAAVDQALKAGLTIVMMTGDAGGTALSVARQIGLPATEMLMGTALDELSDGGLLPHLDGSHVLARVSPAHKMRVVKLLQDNGAVVAMTGDGVNDAPALEQASIGIAMGLRGTDVARGSADLVLTDDNFASIVAAIEEGRRQYANIQKFMRYLLSSNLGEVIAISGGVILGWPLVLLPAQILWMNLVTDGVTALALGIEPAEPDAMEQPPREPAESILGGGGLWWVAGLGAFIGLATLGVFHWSLGTGEGVDLVRAQTLAFTVMVLLEIVNVFNFRSERQAIWTVGLLTNNWLLGAVVVAFGAQVAAIQAPFVATGLGVVGLSMSEWVLLAIISLPILLVGEMAKFCYRRDFHA